MPRYADLKVDMEAVRDIDAQERGRWTTKELAREVANNRLVIQNARRDLVEQGVTGVDQISDEEMLFLMEYARDVCDPAHGEFIEDEMVRLVTGV